MNRAQCIDSLSASEGVFTTAQAERFGISRDILAKSCVAGKLERVAHGAYRSSAVTSSQTDELAAAWKLTAPKKLLHERMSRSSWDGIAVGGTAAAALNEIGDFYLTPIRMYSSQRFQTKNPIVRISTRHIDWEDVDFEYGFPVTRMERTVIDLVLDDEDLSLIRDAFYDAQDKGLDLARLRSIVDGLPPRKKKKVVQAFKEGGLHGL